ncbi:restriction endonuclease subunit S [Providencia rettgeri]
MKKITPKLRFNGFEQNWQSNSFGQIVSNKSKKYNPSLADEDFPCIELDCVSQESGQLLKTYSAKQQSSIKNVFFQGDVLFGKLRPYLKKYLYTTFDGVCSTEFWVLTGKQVTNKFLYQYIQTNTFVESAKKSSGSKMPRADWDIVSSEQFYFPSDKEQNKIADFLSLVDENITLQTLKVELLQQYKKGMMQKLFSQKIRFKDNDGNDFPKWSTFLLKDVADRVTRKNDENNQNILTISAQHGLIDQMTYFNKQIASKNVTQYYLIHYGEFAYNKSYSLGYPMGAIKMLTQYDKGVVSTLYICFKFKEGCVNRFYQHYFESGLQNNAIQKVAQEGARNHGLLNIGVNDFFNIEILTPCYDEQVKIANFLSSIDDKVTLEKTKLDKLKQWKQGLLQQMFV